METVTISSKYQVVIPRTIRKHLKLHPGEKLQAISYDNRIEFIPLKPISQMRGFLKGMNPHFKRDENDHF